MSVTKENLKEFAKRFDGTQWRKFATCALKLKEKDQNPKSTALQKWSKDRRSPFRELHELRHQFFCGDEMFATENSATNDIDKQNISTTQSVTSQTSGGHSYSAGNTEEAVEGNVKRGQKGTDNKDEQIISAPQLIACKAGESLHSSGPTVEVIHDDLQTGQKETDDNDKQSISAPLPTLPQDTSKETMDRDGQDGPEKKAIEDSYEESNGIVQLATSPDNKPRSKFDEKVYKRSGKRHLLIINNSFDTGNSEQGRRTPGCKEDVIRMEALWVDILGCKLFEEKVHQDMTATEMRQIIRRMGENIKKSDCAFLVVIIMSHGGCDDDGEEYLSGMGNDTPNKLYLKYVFEPFREKFENIPKLFIFHGCRGNLLDSGVVVDTRLAPTAFGETLPPLSDFIIVYASAPLHYACEQVTGEVGSWLISSIYHVFKEHFKTMHVCDMLTLVNAEMKEKEGTTRIPCGYLTPIKAMSEFVSFLRDDFCLALCEI